MHQNDLFITTGSCSNIFDIFGNMLTGLWFSFKFLSPFLKTGVIIACLRLDGKMEVAIELLKPERRKSDKISALSLTVFVEMCVSWLTFMESKLKISIKISSLSTCEKEKREYYFLLHTSPILSMLGWSRYFTMSLITGSLMLSEIGSQLAYSAILRLLAILEKRVFRICAVLISLSTISSSLIKAWSYIS